MNRFLSIILGFQLFILNCVAQTGWVILNSGTTNHINDIQFLDENTGYVATWAMGSKAFYGSVRKTVNGGQTWTQVLGIGSGTVYGIHFTDVNTGTAVGGRSGTISRTTNGGISWVSQSSPIGTSNHYAVHFINQNTGVIVGWINAFPSLGVVLYTTNGGNNWLNRSYFGSGVEYYDVYFLDENTGVVVGGWNPPVIRTTDAGNNWTVNSFNHSFNAVSFAGPNFGLMTGYYYIYRSVNAGVNWSIVYTSANNPPIGVDCIDSNYAVAVGSGGVIRHSTDGGTSWIQQLSPTGSALRDVHFIDRNTGWACGNNGVLLKTTTGGVTSVEPVEHSVPEAFSLHQNYPNPFNPVTKIRFDVALSRSLLNKEGLGVVSIRVYDNVGREVATLINEELKPGVYEVNWDAAEFPTGVYYYKLQAGEYSTSRKMVLIR